MIRVEAGMSTSRFCAKFDIPERTWRRWQARARDGEQPKGPWPRPVRDDPVVRSAITTEATAHPAWGHRKIWAMVRHAGHRVSPSTVARAMRDDGLLLPANYTREVRDLAAARKAAFAEPPTGPNRVWQLDFSEYETISGGIWRLSGCRDYFSKYEHEIHLSPTANMHDAVAAVELALAEEEELLGYPLSDLVELDPQTGEIIPVVTIVTDNGGPFRSFTFEAFIAAHPELAHVRTRVRTPQQNGSRERGFGTLKYEWLYRQEIHDVIELAEQIEAWRHDYNHIRPHEALSWNRPADVHAGRATPDTPNFEINETLPKP